MMFKTGDTVIHWSYGLGEVVGLDEKTLAGQVTRYYEVQVKDLTIWVPADGNGGCSLRLPTPKNEFEKLFTVLRETGEPLADDRMLRKSQLLGRLKEGRPESVCRLVRDLTFFGRTKKLNDNDSSILDRAKQLLVHEWQFSLAVPLAQVERELKGMLEENPRQVAG